MLQKTVQGSSQARRIVIGVALLLTLGMGIRQSFGLFLTPVTQDLALTAADFTLTLAIQNIVWGLSQAFVGATADRFGLRITMMVGAAIYVLGLGIMAAAQGLFALIISGSLIGVALSCTATSLGMTACVRAVSEQRRSITLGLVAAAGSLGTVVVPLVHAGSAGTQAVADCRAAFCVDGARDVARCILGRRRRQDAGTQHHNDLNARGARSGNPESAVSRDVWGVFRLRP